jgi:hypothetical protein
VNPNKRKSKPIRDAQTAPTKKFTQSVVERESVRERVRQKARKNIDKNLNEESRLVQLAIASTTSERVREKKKNRTGTNPKKESSEKRQRVRR